ncbi:hypothetical protein KKG41_05265 [Patescibacteria group bacterium]|nr:hypothetical protein [Patescibacteria group bacterium]MBU1890945.1 hypothetical protein [Patescibacteria group bacterium]
MANNVLANAPKTFAKRSNTSTLVVILIVILTIVLVLFGERAFTDLNRSFNPEYQGCRGSYYEPAVLYESISRVNESARCDTSSYRVSELLLHSALAIPILLGAIILYFFTHLRRSGQKAYRGLTWAYLIFALWMLVRLVIELASFLVIQQKTLGVYIVFFVLILVLTGLVIFLQKKRSVE